jgi:hypothetical protein
MRAAVNPRGRGKTSMPMTRIQWNMGEPSDFPESFAAIYASSR